MYFSLKFNIWLGWSDNRLEYHNLNKHYHENAISREFARSLWKPEIVFENNLERQTLRYNPMSSLLMLARNGHWSETTLSQLEEARIYNSNETIILMQTIHLLKFKCSFEMFYFPFDHQTCVVQVSFEMQF